MGELRIAIPDALHKKLKRIALDREVTLKQLLFELLSSYIRNNSKLVSTRKKQGEARLVK